MECAAFVRPAFVIAGGGDRGTDACQSWRCRYRREVLSRAYVGRAIHPHPTIAARQRRRPLDGVESIRALVDVRRPFAFRPPATASVLDHDEESVPGIPG